jgi:hypothetical protein
MRTIGFKTPFLAASLIIALGACQSQTAPGYNSVSMHPAKVGERALWPNTLEDAHERLNKVMKPDQIKVFRTKPFQELWFYHRSLGMWIRNFMGLWQDGPIMKVFADAGMRHPDDVSSIIIRTYWKKLNGRAFTLEGEITEWKRDLNQASNTSPKSLPKEIRRHGLNYSDLHPDQLPVH